MTENQNYAALDLKRLLQILIKRSWVIALSAVLLALIVFGCTYFFVTPLYESTTMLYVNNTSISFGTSFSISSSELTAAQSLVDTYLVILESRTTLEEVIEAAELPYTYEELKEMITASSVNGTEIFQVAVRSHDPAEAEKIANTIAVILPQKIASVVEGSSVQVVDYAVLSPDRVSPSYVLLTALGFFVGAALSLLAVLLYDIFNESIRSEDYLTQFFPEIPLLAVIPDVTSKKNNSYYKNYRYGADPHTKNGGDR